MDDAIEKKPFKLFNRTIVTDVIVIALLLYVVFFMISPQGQELNECRTFKPLIDAAKTCFNSSIEQGRLLCVSQQEYIYRSANLTNQFNFSSGGGYGWN